VNRGAKVCDPVTDSDFDRWLVAAKRGDETAFVMLFRSTQPKLLRYLRALGGALADDVASETWVAVVRGLDRFEGEEMGFRAWVFTIARARLIDAQRRAGRTPAPVDVAELLESRPDGVDVADRVEEIFATEAALALVARLPKDQAEVVLLRHIVGLDVAHCSRILGKRPGTVRVLAHRGLGRLEMLLGAGPEKYDVPWCNAIDESVGY
jgi:RNA polymerase sigma-70 factor, ECF subfamily